MRYTIQTWAWKFKRTFEIYMMDKQSQMNTESENENVANNNATTENESTKQQTNVDSETSSKDTADENSEAPQDDVDSATTVGIP